jgi:hypothetical protein
MSTLLFCAILSWLTKLSKNMEGGLSPQKFSFSTPGTKITVYFLFINRGLTSLTVLEGYS